MLLLRGMPAAVNFGSLILVSSRLSASVFGTFSTVLATTVFLANIGVGPVLNSIISQYAGFERDGMRAQFEGQIHTLMLSAFVFAGVIAVIHSDVGLVAFVVAAYGTLLVHQELQRARLRIRSFGIVATTQAVAFAILAYLRLHANSGALETVALYGISVGVAILLSYMISGVAKPAIPRWEILREPIAIGFSYTISSMSSQSIILLVRYLTAAFASPNILGIVSFSIDLAQRVVTFVISSMAFAFVPLAFRQDAAGKHELFSKTLVTGTVVATGLSLAAALAIIAVESFGFFVSASSTPFELSSFSLIAAGVIIVRVGVIGLDPFAMRARQTRTLIIGYVAAAAVVLVLGYPLTRYGGATGPALVIFVAYLIARLVTAWLLFKKGAFQIGPEC